MLLLALGPWAGACGTVGVKTDHGGESSRSLRGTTLTALISGKALRSRFLKRILCPVQRIRQRLPTGPQSSLCARLGEATDRQIFTN